MDYLDFELEIEVGTGREYPVRVINSPAGQARETMHFPFGELELQNKLQALQIALLRSGGQRRQSLSPEQQTVQDFGRALFDALLTGEVRTLYNDSLRTATLQGRGLRLKLRVNTPEMAALPWEFLYDPRRAEYICLSQDTPILRYLELPQPIQPLTVTPPLRILGMVASPSDLGSLNVAVEKQRVEDSLRDLQAAGRVELTWLEGQTWRALQQAMRRGEWHIFHFIGHGSFDAATDEGLVMLCGEDGAAQRMSATQLGRLLANHRALRLVLLNACEGAAGSTHDLFSSTASILVRRGIPAVLAMQYPITDRAAIEFSRTFYESLVDGLPVDAAVVESRVAISLAVSNTVEWGIPVLYMRTPDERLFLFQESKQTSDIEQVNLKGSERMRSGDTNLPVVRILIVDDHEVVRIGLRSMLNNQVNFQVVDEASSAQEAVEKSLQHCPDVVVMDIRMPGENGIEACREIKEHLPTTEVIMLTSYEEDKMLFDAISAGAAGYVLKQGGADQLVWAIQRVSRGEALLDSAVTQRVLARVRQATSQEQAATFANLTEQELRVLALVSEGSTNKEIAKVLLLGDGTVRNYVSSILSKLGLTNRAEAAAYAVRNNLPEFLEKFS